MRQSFADWRGNKERLVYYRRAYKMNLIVKEFEQLTGKEVYEILKARAEIFLME